jgi:hypothetical protein
MPHNKMLLRVACFLIVFLWMTPGLTGRLTTGGTVFDGYLINGMLPLAIGSTSLEITRVELYFENHRAEITTELNFPKLKAYALVRSTGSGLLQGYWKVDTQILSQISRHVTAGETIILETPEVPPLPTFNPGTHLLRFEIISPSSTIPLPTALYFVPPSEHPVSSVKIVQQAPASNSINEYKPLNFTWKAQKDTTIYLIEFYNREKGATPIFSAYTRKPAYTLDDLCLSKICEIGKPYYWKVKGFDNRKAIIGESDLWRFSFKK